MRDLIVLMKYCNKCEVEKSDESFEYRSDVGKRRSTCRTCTQVKKQEAKAKRELIGPRCGVPDCGSPRKSKGLCSTHWQQQYVKTVSGHEAYKRALEKKNELYKNEEFQLKLKEFRASDDYKAWRSNYQKTSDVYKESRKRYHRSEKYKTVAAKYRASAKRTTALARYTASEKGKAASARSVYKRIERLKAATPSWANVDAIKKFYSLCPEGYCVDHVVPLKGKNVSGLHVEHNLQYLPRRENARKGNNF